MSVTVTNADGITVVMVTSDPNSACPPVCQFLMGLCYQPSWGSIVTAYKGRVQDPSESVLGTYTAHSMALEIMVGTLTIGLGSILASYNSCSNLMFAISVGAVFIFCGIMRIICEKFSRPYLVIIHMLLILAEFGFALAAFIRYTTTLSLRLTSGWDMCDGISYSSETIMTNICLEAKELLKMLLKTMGIMLLILFVLVFGVVIITIILRIDAICNREGKNEIPLFKDTEDSELYKAQQEDVPINLKV